MSVVEVVRLPVAPDSADALVAAVQRGRAGYLAPPRCAGVELLRHDDATEVLVLATWESQAAHDAAAAEPAAAEFMDELAGLLAGPPATGFYERR